MAPVSIYTAADSLFRPDPSVITFRAFLSDFGRGGGVIAVLLGNLFLRLSTIENYAVVRGRGSNPVISIDPQELPVS